MRSRVPLEKRLRIAGARLAAICAPALCAGAFGFPACAQLRAPADTPAEVAMLPTGAATESLARSLYSLLPAVPAETAVESPAPAWKPIESRAALIEMPTAVGLGRPARRQYAFGIRSDAFRSWLADVGVDADQCMAPIVRMSTRIGADGDFRGALWVYARCTLR